MDMDAFRSTVGGKIDSHWPFAWPNRFTLARRPEVGSLEYIKARPDLFDAVQFRLIPRVQ